MKAVVLLGWIATGLASLMAATVGSLRCEFLENPEGIDVIRPSLSWIQKSDERGARQTAWQVLVASSAETLAGNRGDLWDSGKVEDDRSIHVRYEGLAPVSSRPYFWKVRIWDQHGEASEWSETAHWSTGLGEEDWKGSWIGKDTKVEKEELRGAAWIAVDEKSNSAGKPLRHFFRRSFVIPKDRKIRRGEFYLGVNGSFGSAVNGNSHGGGRGYADATMVDIGPHLKGGKNTFAMWVETEANAARPEPALVGRIEIHFEEGEPLILPTGPEWMASAIETEGWIQADADESAWKAVKAMGDVGMEPWGKVMLPASRVLPALQLRKEFEIEEKPVRAMLYFTGLGLSECEVNGTKAGDHVLSPALTEYDKRVVYVTHDVTDLVKKGKNAIGVHLGNGRYHAPRSKWFVMTRDFGVPRVRLQLEMEFADGGIERVVSDGDWRMTDQGPIRANNEYDGEAYDARMEQDGWSEVGFDDAAWEEVSLMTAPEGSVVAQMQPPIRVTGTLKPLSIKEISPGVFIYDMGQNMVGWCRLKVQGPAGTAVRLRHAETLSSDGRLFLANMRSAEVTDVYHLKGGGPEVYEPRFTYHGFRYVEVTGFPGKPDLDAIEGCVVNDDLPSAGSFECSDELINRFHQNVHWGVRGNYRSVPTDCPQRDERQAWLGDRTFRTRGETFMFDTAAFYSKWQQDIVDTQKESGSISDVCPSYWPLYNDNVAWPACAIVLPETLLDQYADVTLIEHHYPALKRWIDHMSKFIENGLISRDNYGDWCVPPEDPSLIHSVDPGRKTHPTIIASSYFSHCLKLMARYARLLGKEDEAKIFEDRSLAMAAALHEKFYNEEKGYYDNGSQTSCVLPLAFGLVPEDARERVFGHLVSKIENETKGHLGTGLVGGQWINRVLTEGGRADLVMGFATETDYPSWGYMIEKGATTVWELWNGDTANPAMNSGNHVMLVGDFIIWLYEDLAGIKSDPTSPGFKHVVMKPHLVDGLDHARAVHESPYGQIVSSWSKKPDGGYLWEITVPPNTTATLHLPRGGAPEEDGRPLAESPGIERLGEDEGRQTLRVPAGSYRFES